MVSGSRTARRGSPPPLLEAFALCCFFVVLGGVPVGAQEVPPLVTPAEYERWIEELSNWGRWGPDDELGALNLITPAKRVAATALVREGITVSLASTAQTERTIDNPCPLEWEMANANRGGATDRIAYRCIHGPGTTHIDGFAHWRRSWKIASGDLLSRVDSTVACPLAATPLSSPRHEP